MSLTGREREVAELCKLVRERGLVTVTGAPGVGKSRLAWEVAGILGASGAEAKVVDLGAVHDPGQLTPAVAATLGLEHASRDAGAATAAGGRRLVVLDDCDDVVIAAADAAQGLLGAGVLVFATCQGPLGVEGEAVSRLRPLSLPSPDWVAESDGHGESAAMRLFCERAAEVQPGFVLTAEVAPAVAAICRRLAGLPLAIAAAARRLDGLSPAEILAGLEEDPIAFLAAEQRDAHCGLWATIEASHDRLSVRERRLWARVSVFAGGFDLQAAQTVCGGGGHSSRPGVRDLGGVARTIAGGARHDMLAQPLLGACTAALLRCPALAESRRGCVPGRSCPVVPGACRAGW